MEEKNGQLVPKMLFINEAYLRSIISRASPESKIERNCENNGSNYECLETLSDEDFTKRHILEDGNTCSITSNENRFIIASSSLPLRENSTNFKMAVNRINEEYKLANDSNLSKSENEKEVEIDQVLPSNYSQQIKLESNPSAYVKSGVFYPMTTNLKENQELSKDSHDTKLLFKQEADILFNSMDNATTHGDVYSEILDEKPTELLYPDSQGTIRQSCEVIPEFNYAETTRAMEDGPIHPYPKLMDICTKKLNTIKQASCKLSIDLEQNVEILKRRNGHPCSNVCKKELNQSEQPVTYTETENHSGEKSHQCSVCRKVFNDSFELTKHMGLHTGKRPYQCSVCRKSFSQRSILLRHIRIHTKEKPYECSVCRKAFNVSSNLTTHMRIHTGEKPYECSVCGKPFNDYSTFTKHLRIHTGEKNYQCSVCRKVLSNSSSLTKHMRLHTGEKPYLCSVCRKVFNDSFALTIHMRIHTGEKPHQCSVCRKTFNQKSILTRHMKIHTGEKPHQCSVCTKSFIDCSSLTKHMKIHSADKPHQCSVCEKAFSQSSHLTRHMKIHSGEKSHQCSVCAKAFSQSSHLIIHMRIHTGEKPYECSICKKAFIESYGLTKHMRIHTDKNTL